MRVIVIIFSLFCLLFLPSCGIFFDDSNDWEENVQVEIGGIVFDPIQPEEEIKLACKVEGVDEKEPIFYSWSADGGEFNINDEKEVKWTAPSSSGLATIKVEVKDKDGNSVQDDFSFIVGDVDGLIFEHKLIVEQDMSKRPRMEVLIRNIKTDVLELDVIGTIYGNIADEAGPEEKLFPFIHYDTMKINDSNGQELMFQKEGRRLYREDLGNYFYDECFNIDGLDINNGKEKSILIQYELVSSHELWEGFGTDLEYFEDNPSEAWMVFKEWFVLRPREQRDGVILSNTLEIDLPSGWKYAATYPQINTKTIDLGDLKFMRWNNELGWKNYQRAPFVIFKHGPFLIRKESVAGVLVQDIYSKKYDSIRNHEANHQFIDFLSNYVGELPVDKVLTFVGPEMCNGSAISHGDAYARAPYGYGYSSLGRFFGSGADIGTDGRKLPEPQRWCIENWPDEEGNHHFPSFGTKRLWAGTMIRGHNLDGFLAAYLENLAVASYYTDWCVEKNRFKPMYEFYLEKVVQPDGSEKEKKAITGHSFFRFKSALALYYFDHLIIEETDGQRDLSFAIQKVYDEFLNYPVDHGNYQKPMEILINALNNAVDGEIDFREKVKGYCFGDIYGHEFIDLSDYLDVDLSDYDIPFE